MLSFGLIRPQARPSLPSHAQQPAVLPAAPQASTHAGRLSGCRAL